MSPVPIIKPLAICGKFGKIFRSNASKVLVNGGLSKVSSELEFSYCSFKAKKRKIMQFVPALADYC